VFAGYVSIKNNQAKVEYELAAIRKLTPLLIESEKFGCLGVITDVYLPRINPELRYKQLALWLYALVSAVDLPVDEVAMGIHAAAPDGPDAMLPQEDFRRIWAALRPLLKTQPALVFPILDLEWPEVRRRLRPDLRALCVYCEDPVREGDGFKKCGTCPPCKKYG